MSGIPFPDFDPVALQLGPIAIRWYALAYIAGIVGGWRIAAGIVERDPRVCTRTAIDDFVAWVTIGIIAGGRLGYVLFYKPGYYLSRPLEIAAVWQGGMSFHGGMLGVILATIIFARRRGIPLLALADVVALVAPIGLFFGRLANFVNGELWGRVADVPWAMVFPHDPARLARHPSQIYEAALEGLVLFAILALLAWRTEIRRRPGALGGVFLVGYGLARFACEFFREPDAHLGFLFAGATMGQLLSLPMIAVGLALIARARQQPRFDGLPAPT